jgi:hypothetical protein
VWIDPEHQLVFIFLSNRIHPSANQKLLSLNIRPRILDAVYEALGVREESPTAALAGSSAEKPPARIH